MREREREMKEREEQEGKWTSKASGMLKWKVNKLKVYPTHICGIELKPPLPARLFLFGFPSLQAFIVTTA